jgi:molybdopterin-synthase adenylyltransferase
MLDGNARERYLRQIAISGFGEEAQERLSKARVVIAGAGGLGCGVSLYLAAAGVGEMRIVDPGEVELSNLNRQVLYTEGDIGAGKAEAAARRIALLNPRARLEPVRAPLEDGTAAGLVRGFDLVIDALDNLPARSAVNHAAVDGGIPIVHGAVGGFHGQVMTVLPGRTACLRCLYRGSEAAPAGPVIGVAAGLIGLLQATEAIKCLTGLGRALAGRLLLCDGLAMSFAEVEIPRDPRCPHCGGR